MDEDQIEIDYAECTDHVSLPSKLAWPEQNEAGNEQNGHRNKQNEAGNEQNKAGNEQNGAGNQGNVIEKE
jgi:hypothetical protein